MNNRLTLKRIVVYFFILTAGAVFSGCTSDDGDSTDNLDMNKIDNIWDGSDITTGISVEEIAGKGGRIVYQGTEYTDRVDIPEGAIVGVVKNNQAYLYHPAMGKNVKFSSETNKQAVAYFMLGIDSAGIGIPEAVTAFDTIAGNMLTASKIIESSDEVDLATKIHISRDGNNLKFTNNARRWAALSITNEGEEKIYFLPPAGRTFDSNLQRWALAEADELFGGMPTVDDVTEFFSSVSSLTLTVPSTATIETHGAIFRGLPWHAANFAWPAGSSEAWQSNHRLVILLNTIDFYYTLIEGLKHLLGLFPLECLDIVTGSLMNMIEAEFLGYMTVEERIETDYYTVLKQDAWNSFVNCAMLLPSVMTWEFVNTFWDVIAAMDFLVEDLIITDSGMANVAAFELATLKESQEQSVGCIIGTWAYYGDSDCDGRFDESFTHVFRFNSDGSSFLDALEGRWTLTGNTLVITHPVDSKLVYEATVKNNCNLLEGESYYNNKRVKCWQAIRN